MTTPKPISSAPRDGSTVMVRWTDADGQENESLARYRPPGKTSPGDGLDQSESGWWVFVDGDTQKRIQPHSWTSPDADTADDQ